MNKDFNYLNKLTKSQIIQFLKEKYWFHAITEKKAMMIIWDSESKRLQDKMNKHMDSRDDSLGKKADELATKFNAEKDPAKKLEYLEKREGYILQIQNYHREWGKINQAMIKNEEIFDKYI